jgi:hypothetical protein
MESSCTLQKEVVYNQLEVQSLVETKAIPKLADMHLALLKADIFPHMEMQHNLTSIHNFRRYRKYIQQRKLRRQELEFRWYIQSALWLEYIVQNMKLVEYN